MAAYLTSGSFDLTKSGVRDVAESWVNGGLTNSPVGKGANFIFWPPAEKGAITPSHIGIYYQGQVWHDFFGPDVDLFQNVNAGVMGFGIYASPLYSPATIR